MLVVMKTNFSCLVVVVFVVVFFKGGGHRLQLPLLLYSSAFSAS